MFEKSNPGWGLPPWASVRAPPLEKIAEIGERLRIFESNETLGRLLMAAQYSSGAEEYRQLLWLQIQKRLEEIKASGLGAFPYPPVKAEVLGFPIIGKVELSGAPYGIEPDAHLGNTLIVGASGFGKTVACTTIAAAASVTTPTWIISLNREYKKLFPEFLVLRSSQLRFNLLLPPPGYRHQQGVREWAAIVATILSQSTGILEAGRAFCTKRLIELYERYKPWEGGTFPCLRDLKDYVERQKIHIMSGDAKLRSTFLNRLDAILGSAEIYDCSEGHSLLKLAQASLVLECDGNTPETEKVLIVGLLLWLFHYHLANSEQDEGLRQLICTDEASRLYDRSAEFKSQEGVPISATLIMQVRKCGMALVVASQAISRLQTAVIENCSRKIIFRQGEGHDINTVASSLRLSHGQADVLARLEVGQCLVREPSYPEPFIARIDKIR